MSALCKVSDIVPGKGKEVVVMGTAGHRFVALFLVEGEVCAFLNSCPHQFRSLNWAPDEFLFSENGLLVCPHHGASFELPGGQCIEGPCKGDQLSPIAVEIRDGEVFLIQPSSE